MGGGGQGSGKVGYAAYLESAHMLLITGTNALLETSTTTLYSALTTAWNGNPYTAASAYDPDSALDAMDDAVSDLIYAAARLDSDVDLASKVATFDAIATSELVNNTLPKLAIAARDIGAVQSSSFVIGTANLYASKNRTVDKFTSDMIHEREKLWVDTKKNITQYAIESKRMRIAAKHDEEQRDTEIDAHAALWTLDAVIKSGQFLGALGGGSTIPDKPNKAKSAVSGALAGAAAGAYVGSVVPGIGTGIGAAGGAVLGASAAFL